MSWAKRRWENIFKYGPKNTLKSTNLGIGFGQSCKNEIPDVERTNQGFRDQRKGFPGPIWIIYERRPRWDGLRWTTVAQLDRLYYEVSGLAFASGGFLLPAWSMASLVSCQLGPWSAWSLASLVHGQLGFLPAWSMVSLVSCQLGLLPAWSMVSLVSWQLGPWPAWFLASLVDGEPYSSCQVSV